MPKKTPFWKKKDAPKVKEENLQDIEKEFNQNLFEMGQLTYQRTMVQDELARLNDAIHSKRQILDNIGKRGRDLHSKIESEIQEKIASAPKAHEAVQ